MPRERFNTSELLSGRGSIDVITGPMFSGKTDELIRRLHIATIAIDKLQQNGILPVVDISRRIIAFKPSKDTRRGMYTINTQDKQSYPATPLENAHDSLAMVSKDLLIAAFDESQFWEERDLVETVRTLAKNKGVVTIVAGLSLDFRGEKWGGVGTLLMEADIPDVQTAICTKCGHPALYTQRIINGRPAFYDDPVEVVGADELYESRCRTHHEVPKRPAEKLNDG